MKRIPVLNPGHAIELAGLGLKAINEVTRYVERYDIEVSDASQQRLDYAEDALPRILERA